MAECDAYEEILNCETIDIFNFITGKDPIPPRLDTDVLSGVQESPIGRFVTDSRTHAHTPTHTGHEAPPGLLRVVAAGHGPRGLRASQDRGEPDLSGPWRRGGSYAA